jgi:hemoglobin
MTTVPQAIDRLGGPEAVDKMIERFYAKVRADPSLAPFFESSDMAHLLAMQREFIAAALGDDSSYSMSAIHQAHAGRGIRGRHFVRFLDLFLESLEESGLDAENSIDVDRVLERMALAASDVIDEVGVDG